MQQVGWLPHCNDLVSRHDPHLHSQTTRITITTISATAIRAPMIPPAIAPALPSPAGEELVLGVVGVFSLPTRKNMSCHLSFVCMNCLQLAHMHYSLVSVWGVVWEVIEPEPWNEKIKE